MVGQNIFRLCLMTIKYLGYKIFRLEWVTQIWMNIYYLG